VRERHAQEELKRRGARREDEHMRNMRNLRRLAVALAALPETWRWELERAQTLGIPMEKLGQDSLNGAR